MNETTNNKELVAAGHELARHMSSDTPIIDIAKMVTRLASQLDVTTVALRQANAELKASVAAEIEWEKTMMQAVGEDGIADVVSAIDALKKRTFTIKLPDGYAVRSGHPINEGERGVMILKEGGDWLHRFDVEHAIRTAGYQLAAEEQQPVAWRYRYHNGFAPSNWRFVDKEGECNMGPNYQRQALYLHPQQGKAVQVPDDARRMDWLVSKTVNVREPQVYGSHSMFWSQTISDDWSEVHATTLREQIDAAMEAESAPQPEAK